MRSRSGGRWGRLNDDETLAVSLWLSVSGLRVVLVRESGVAGERVSSVIREV